MYTCTVISRACSQGENSEDPPLAAMLRLEWKACFDAKGHVKGTWKPYEAVVREGEWLGNVARILWSPIMSSEEKPRWIPSEA